MNALMYERYLKPGKEPEAPSAPEAQQALGGSSWEMNFGPLALSAKGVSVKPQMMLGGKFYNFSAEAGLHDLREGVKVNAKAQAFLDVFAEARSIGELHSSIECNTPGFHEALEAVKWLLNTTAGAAGSAVGIIAEKLNMSSTALAKLLHGDHQDTDRRPMMLRVKVSTGLGASAEVRLGWTDPKGV
jgi:hypothetical protein